MDKYIGKRLDGRYEIHELLGVGGMAYVYKAYDNIEKRWVAIKILKEELAGNSDFLRRFRNESKAIAVLSHPNIVKVYDVSFGDRIQYIVMEYIDGITLKQYIEQQGEIKWREALYFTVQILRALQHAHEKGIIHRDIKPQNIMLLEDGTIKVTDFGIARFSQAETQTMTDKAIGSVHYIAPEQARGGYINDKADIYSVGVMLYEMLTGQLPFVADNAVSVAIMQMQAEPTPPSRINPSIPKGLEEITMHAMEKNPAQRFPSAADMLEDVERFRRNPEIVFHYGEQVDRAYAGTSADIYGNVQQNAAPQKYNDNYEYEEEYVRSQNSNRASKIIVGIVAAVVFVAIVGVIYLVKGKGANSGSGFLSFLPGFSTSSTTSDEIVLPKFVGMIYASDIEGNSEYADLTFEITYGNVPSKQPGEVLRQTPAAGMTVKKGKTVSLTVNGEAEQVVDAPERRERGNRVDGVVRRPEGGHEGQQQHGHAVEARRHLVARGEPEHERHEHHGHGAQRGEGEVDGQQRGVAPRDGEARRADRDHRNEGAQDVPLLLLGDAVDEHHGGDHPDAHAETGAEQELLELALDGGELRAGEPGVRGGVADDESEQHHEADGHEQHHEHRGVLEEVGEVLRGERADAPHRGVHPTAPFRSARGRPPRGRARPSVSTAPRRRRRARARRRRTRRPS